MEFRDLKRQYQVLKPQMDAAMLEVAENCNFISGKQVTELEQQLAEYVGVKHCVTCGNGTDALTLVMMAWDIKAGDAVFVPTFTFFASAEVVAFEGATPVFVDVDERTFNVDPVKLEEAIEQVKKEGKLNPRAVIAVDLFGQPADYTKIEEICKKHGLLLLEDGAQGFGGKIGDRTACSFGDAAATSFFPAKPLGCYGDGGAVFTNDDEMADYMRSIRVHGKSPADKYDNLRIGLNFRLDTIQAAVLKVKLQAFKDHELESVNRAAKLYDEYLGDVVKHAGCSRRILFQLGTVYFDSGQQGTENTSAERAEGTGNSDHGLLSKTDASSGSICRPGIQERGFPSSRISVRESSFSSDAPIFKRRRYSICS